MQNDSHAIEYVMGFCSKEQHERFLQVCPRVEKYIVDTGIQLIKFWLKVGDEEQKRRFEARSLIPSEEVRREKVELPKRSKKEAYDEIASIASRRFVAEKY
jgi:polyphosphate kinase 2 (PPK2 family)